MSTPSPQRRRRAVRAVRAQQEQSSDPEVMKEIKDRLRTLYKRVKSLKIASDNSEEERKAVQKEAIELAREHGLMDVPIRFSVNGTIYTATITAPEPRLLWDTEKLVDYLHRTGRWDACSSQVLDMTKVEAEIAAGNIPKSVVKRLTSFADPTSPYVNARKV